MFDATTLQIETTNADDADFEFKAEPKRAKLTEWHRQTIKDVMAAHAAAGHAAAQWDDEQAMGYWHSTVVRQFLDFPEVSAKGKTDKPNLWAGITDDGFLLGLLGRPSAPGWEPGQNGKTAYTVARRSPWLTRSELMAKFPKPAQALVETILHRGKMTMLVADPKVGKSLIATEVSVCVAHGREFWGLKSSQGIVGYVDYEQDGYETHDRLTAIARCAGN